MTTRERPVSMLPIVIEQSTKYTLSTIILTCVDIETTFDSLKSKALWYVLWHIHICYKGLYRNRHSKNVFKIKKAVALSLVYAFPFGSLHNKHSTTTSRKFTKFDGDYIRPIITSNFIRTSAPLFSSEYYTVL